MLIIQNLELWFCLEFHHDCIEVSILCKLWKTGEWFLPMVHYFPRYLTVSEYVCTCLRQRLDQSQASIGDHQPIRAQETAWTPELSNERPVRVTVDQWEARKLRRAVWHYPGAQCEARVWSVNTAPDIWGMVEWHALPLCSADSIHRLRSDPGNCDIYAYLHTLYVYLLLVYTIHPQRFVTIVKP